MAGCEAQSSEYPIYREERENTACDFLQTSVKTILEKYGADYVMQFFPPNDFPGLIFPVHFSLSSNLFSFSSLLSPHSSVIMRAYGGKIFLFWPHNKLLCTEDRE
jgi:hypothetical protein